MAAACAELLPPVFSTSAPIGVEQILLRLSILDVADRCNDNSIGDADTSLNSKVLSCLAVNQIEGFFFGTITCMVIVLQKNHLQATVQFKNGCDEVSIALHAIQHKLEGASQWCAFFLK